MRPPLRHLVLLLASAAAPAWAAEQTVTLSVPGMSCPTCPITINRALRRVPGVLQVHSNLEQRQSTVTYDDRLARVQNLTAATEAAGYPSTVMSAASR